MTKALIRTLALWLALWPALVVAQQYPVVPDHTVVGRVGTGSGSGPSSAIPFSTLYANLTGGNTAAANQIPVFPGAGGQPVPTTVGGSGGLFDAICSSTIGQAWVRLSSGWGCKSLGFANPVWWGADPTGVADSTSAINSAIAASLTVYIPAGTFTVSTSITLSTAGQSIIGAGWQSSTLSSTSTTNPMLVVNAGINNLTLNGFGLTRSVTATTGAQGINFVGNTETTTLSNLYIQKQFIGLVLASTDWAIAKHIITTANQSDGLFQTNTSGNNASQWQLDDILSSQNVGNGFSIISAAGSSQMTVGQISKLTTFANSGKGFDAAAVGSGSPIFGLRVVDSFFGQDGNDEVFLDTFGTGSSPHTFVNVMTELAGTIATGPTLGTAHSNLGSGFNITANNAAVTLIGCSAIQHSVRGLLSSATALAVIGGEFLNNGQAGSTSGISIAAASTVRLQGLRSTGSPQAIGIFLGAAAINGVISGNDVSGTGGSITNSSTGTTLRIKDNVGYNPVGLTAGTSTGTSASTITAGPSPETHYITQSANFNALVKSGATSLCTVPSATVPCVIELGPNEAYTVTWTTTQPTYSKFVH